MNQNHPFFSTNTNLYNESLKSSTPTTLHGQNVIVSQEQQRQVYDVLNTSISGNPFQMNPMFQPQILQAQKQRFPGGVYFSFLQSVPQEICKCNPSINCNNMASTVKSFFPSSLEPIRMMPQGPTGYVNYPERPYQLKLHYDAATSCSDLLNHFTQVPASMGYPDLSGICGYLHQNRSSDESKMSSAKATVFPLPPTEYCSNAKTLVVRNKINPITAHVVGVLDETKNSDDKKKVSFSDNVHAPPDKHDQSIQFTSDCTCGTKKCKGARKKSKKKYSDDEERDKKEKSEKNRKRDKSSDSAKGSSDSDSTKQQRRHWFGKRTKFNQNKASKTSTNSESDCESEQNTSSTSYSSNSES